MFEQESYSLEVPAEPLRQGDLFYKYEVGRWQLNNRIYAILAAAAIINFAFFGVLAQTNILTARGCESPFVGRVCQVLDMTYVGAMLFGTDREFADAEYERSELGDAEVIWIDQTGVPAQLEYPEGYFQLANPEQFAQQQAMLNNSYPVTDGFSTGGFPPISPPIQSGSSLIDTPPVAPKNNPKARPNNLPDSPFDLSDVNGENTAANKTDNKGNANTNSAKPKDTVANNNANTADQNAASEEAKADKFGIYINKRPMRVKAEETLADVNANKVKLDNPFKVTVSGTLGLGKDGKTVILKDAKPVPDKSGAKNDPAMEKLVQDWILAVGDAGWLGYLDKLKAKTLIITVEQNDTNLIAAVRADQPSENVASTAASGLNSLLQIAATQVNNDEKTFLENAKVTTEGKTFVLNFSIPKPVVQEMIKRKLDEQAADIKKPSGNALAPQSSNTAAK